MLFCLLSFLMTSIVMCSRKREVPGVYRQFANQPEGPVGHPNGQSYAQPCMQLYVQPYVQPCAHGAKVTVQSQPVKQAF